MVGLFLFALQGIATMVYAIWRGPWCVLRKVRGLLVGVQNNNRNIGILSNIRMLCRGLSAYEVFRGAFSFREMVNGESFVFPLGQQSVSGVSIDAVLSKRPCSLQFHDPQNGFFCGHELAAGVVCAVKVLGGCNLHALIVYLTAIKHNALFGSQQRFVPEVLS